MILYERHSSHYSIARSKYKAPNLVQAEVDIRAKARDQGIVLRVSICQSGYTTFQHWMFELAKQDRHLGFSRLLNYYPGTGHFAIPRNCDGFVSSPDEALQIAVEIFKERKGTALKDAQTQKV